MAQIWADRILETSTTTGTGPFTLAGAVAGYRTFGSVMTAPSDTCYYFIEAVGANGVPTGDWETGLGTYSGANTLTRTIVLGSSNAGAAVNFSAGTKRVGLASLASFVGPASSITNTPSGNIAATNVQAAIAEVDSEKVAKAGDTMTGALTISVTGSASIDALKILSPNTDESVLMTMETEGAASPSIQQTSYRSASAGPNFAISRHARGTRLAPSILAANDRLIDIRADGHDGAAFQSLMFIQGVVTQAVPAVGAMGTSLIVRLCPDGSGSITSSSGEAMRLNHASGISLFGSSNIIIDQNRLHRLRQYTVATLPTVGIAGRLAAVTDASAPTYNATVAGGGAVNIPVYDNGANWTCH